MAETDSSGKFRLYNASELQLLSEPEWQIEKLFTVGSMAGLYGPSGEGKSFVALDWALSVAEGRPWFGRRVQQSPVVYVAAEGGRSIRKRVSAWMRHRGCAEVSSAFFLLESVQVRAQDDLDLLATRIRDLGIKPGLIVLDTLARCFVGGDENSGGRDRVDVGVHFSVAV